MYKKSLYKRFRRYVFVIFCGILLALSLVFNVIKLTLSGNLRYMLLFISPTSILILLMFAFFAVFSIKELKKYSEKLKILKDTLGVSTPEEIDEILSACKVQIRYKLFIDDEKLINLYTIETYPVTDIIDVCKEERKHGKRRHYFLNITTKTHKDEVYFERRTEDIESAYTQVKAILYTNKLRDNRNIYYNTNVAEQMTEIDDPYAGMIMDEEDIKDRENRSDWLSSV